MNTTRTVVLGLDSLPPGLVSDLAESGVMPFVNELIGNGSFGPLRSRTHRFRLEQRLDRTTSHAAWFHRILPLQPQGRYSLPQHFRPP